MLFKVVKNEKNEFAERERESRSNKLVSNSNGQGTLEEFFRKKFSKKSRAQGTLEYLVIIAVVVVLALVVVGLLINQTGSVGNVSRSTSKISSSAQVIGITESLVSPTDGNFVVRLLNNSGEFVTISNVRVGDVNVAFSEDLVQGNSKLFKVRTDVNCELGKILSKDVVITYVSENGLTKTQRLNDKVMFDCTPYTIAQANLANQCSDYGGSQSLSANSYYMNAGVYSATDLNAIDSDLNAKNIWGKTIFGVTGLLGAHSGLTKCTAWNGTTWVNATTCSDVNVPANQDAALDSARGMFDTSGRFVVGTFVDGNKYVRDTWNDLMWWDNHSAGVMDWNTAMSYCNTFRANGYSNWRLATVAEAYQIFDYGASYNGGSNACAKGFTDCFGFYVWTSSSLSWSPTDVYKYTPSGGYVNFSSKTSSGYARCVRFEN